MDTPILLHLVHPRALDHLNSALTHVRRFRTHLGSLSARGENAQIAKDVLVDLVDCSGVDLGLLLEVLRDAKGVSGMYQLFEESETVIEVDNGTAEDSRRSLAHCRPTPETYSFLQETIQKLQASPSVADKTRLFVKPYELVDGLARLSVAERKDKQRDVVSKGMLVGHGPIRTCVRCAGKSVAGTGDGNVAAEYLSSKRLSSKWLAWERMWLRRCVCGGSWVE